jgi:hypothetical protein
MKITIETDGTIGDLKAELEEALLSQDDRDCLDSIATDINQMYHQRNVMLNGVQQCTEAVRTITQRIPKKYTVQGDICDKTEELIELIENDLNWVVADDDKPTKGRELQILVNDIRALLVELKEEP